MDLSEATGAIQLVVESGRFQVPVFKRFADFKRVTTSDFITNYPTPQK
jgi:hypothetical protein